MKKRWGRLTLPSEHNFYEETKELLERLGADAIRDSDGTKLPDDIKDLDAKIYTTYFVARGYNDFARENMDLCQHFYLSSNFTVATEEKLSIHFMEGYFKDQVKPDYDHDPSTWWEVINRTTGEVVPTSLWRVDAEKEVVEILQCSPFHEYSVNFLAYAIWDPTQMYNHMTNNWGDKEKDIPFDIRLDQSWDFAMATLKQWLEDNPKTDVVRFTTFFYHFTLVFNDKAMEKFVDWFGYSASVSPKALLEFEKEYGYRLRPEDIVDEGYYNNPFRVPSKQFLDYMDFQQRFVSKKAKELVDEVHKAGKEAVMFLGDNWIGTEPFGKYFKDIGLDGVAGSVGNGVTLRLISEIPHLKYTEGRFLPYFFPDTFYEGNDPSIEGIENWVCARRAMFRKPLQRMGYGGYLSLAYPFKKFVETMENVAEEFRLIVETVEEKKPVTNMKVGIVNSWGRIRTWQPYMVAHAKWYQNCYSYAGVLEALSGMDVDVEFISFDDIENGVDPSFDVLINAGDAYTAYSGGKAFLNEKVIASIRKFVYEGGGFIGVGEPSAIAHQGKFFQLRDLLGVDVEKSLSQSTNKYFLTAVKEHFLVNEMTKELPLGEPKDHVYATCEETKILRIEKDNVRMATKESGKGRSFYITGLPYTPENSQFLRRVLYYVSGKEELLDQYSAKDPRVEVVGFGKGEPAAILNNSMESVSTQVHVEGKTYQVDLSPGEMKWVNREE